MRIRKSEVSSVILNKVSFLIGDNNVKAFGFCLMLSWIYAICSQITIVLPFKLVPISLQPLPLFIAALILGRYAIYAFGFYYVQGALGLPFFAGFQGGFLRLFGPTGGYLLGFGLAMSYLAKTRNSRRGVPLALKLLVACIIYFACGLLQLSVFLPLDKLLFAGLYPFIIGDLIKMTFVWFFIKKINEIKG